MMKNSQLTLYVFAIITFWPNFWSAWAQDQEKEVCPICLEEMNDESEAIKFGCESKPDHLFHKKCYQSLKPESCCPLCRKSNVGYLKEVLNRSEFQQMMKRENDKEDYINLFHQMDAQKIKSCYYPLMKMAQSIRLYTEKLTRPFRVTRAFRASDSKVISILGLPLSLLADLSYGQYLNVQDRNERLAAALELEELALLILESRMDNRMESKIPDKFHSQPLLNKMSQYLKMDPSLVRRAIAHDDNSGMFCSSNYLWNNYDDENHLYFISTHLAKGHAWRLFADVLLGSKEM